MLCSMLWFDLLCSMVGSRVWFVVWVYREDWLLVVVRRLAFVMWDRVLSGLIFVQGRKLPQEFPVA